MVGPLFKGRSGNRKQKIYFIRPNKSSLISDKCGFVCTSTKSSALGRLNWNGVDAPRT